MTTMSMLLVLVSISMLSAAPAAGTSDAWTSDAGNFNSGTSTAGTPAAGAPADVDAAKLTLSPPAEIVAIDLKKLKGTPARLTWSPDARHVYLQTVERDRSGAIKNARHYLLGLDGTALQGVEAEPDWSAAYWTWKSGRAAPGRPSFSIDVEQQQKRVSATSAPMGGDLARGGGSAGSPSGPAPGPGLGPGDVVSAAVQSQMTNVFTLKLKGEIIGEFINAPAVPGLTFGWAPAGSDLIAFVNQGGRVVVMDARGGKQEVGSSKAALLPAWSDDGKRLAYLEKTDKNKATLKIVDVKRLE